MDRGQRVSSDKRMSLYAQVNQRSIYQNRKENEDVRNMRGQQMDGG